MALTFADLPAPPAGSNRWGQAYTRFLAAGDAVGYEAWLLANKPDQYAAWKATGSTTPGAGSPGSAPGGPTGAVPIPDPVPVNVGGMANAIGRFGEGGIQPYTVGTSYAGPQSPAGAPATIPATGTAPEVPAPASGLPGAPQAPSPVTPTVPAPGTLPKASKAERPGGGMLGGGGGWQGGEGRTGMLGGGFTGNGGAERGGMLGGTGGSGVGDYIDLGDWGAGALTAAGTLAPFPYSLPFTLAGLGMRGYNTAVTDDRRSALGIPGLGFGQALGGILGLNRYGSLSDPQIANRDDAAAGWRGATGGVSPAGYYSPGLLARLFGDDQTTEYTPNEYRLRQIAGGYRPPGAATTPQPLGPLARPSLPAGGIQGPMAPAVKSPYQGMSPERIAALGLDPNPSAISGGVSYSGNASDPRSPNFGGYGGAITGSSGPMRGGMLW